MNAAARTAERGAATLRDPRWQAVLSRDATADGSFVYSVQTTGVYCRPSCAARRARPEHVRFFANGREAQAAGFRACKRCKPDEPSLLERYGAKVTKACRLIERAETAPSLEALAKAVSMSPYHFHRIFKQITGTTPRQYATAHRERRVRDRLQMGARVTDAIFDAGYGSNSRFYEKAGAVLGMKPRDYRAGGANATIKFAVGECSLGSILVAQSERGICAILLGDDPDALVRDLQDRFPRANLIGGDRQFEEVVAKVVGFVESPGVGLHLPLDVRGTSFQQRVWRALRSIPVGETVTYAQLAQRIGAPKAVRAVAGACASNALAVAIPCHRVIRNDGTLSGYRWGVERKRALLQKEASNAPTIDQAS
ncbi:MAG: bifunctional DNA-binding transcriptional regulator/O6-methylguanine-DNA methyltransferase Ada [Xanthomonadaceae bacterium]|nr:bifunctional DNA-binding transcriptional regulator/O6-methylguanine-DNA methyltransferase Ada [Xanthomonadaceae bacterium]